MNRKGVLLSFVAFYTFIFLPLTPLFAQEANDPAPDVVAPYIQHAPSDQAALAGLPLAIQAVITDNVGVQEVILYYRPKGAEEYTRLQMEDIGEDLFSATLPSSEVTIPQIEYYIQAVDQAGNISFRGFSFTPLSMAIVASPPLIKDPNSPDPDLAALERITLRNTAVSPPWYKKWWIWTLVGAVAVAGGIAAAGGHGGNGGKDSGGGSPTTGSVAITGPTVGR